MRKVYKRALSWILTLVMCLSAFTIPAYAGTAPNASVSAVGTENGDTVSFAVTLSTDTPLYAAAIVLKYDADKVEYSSMDSTGSSFDLVKAKKASTNDAVCVDAGMFLSPVTGSLNIGTLNFTIKDGYTKESFNKTTFAFDTTGLYDSQFKGDLGVTEIKGANVQTESEEDYVIDASKLSITYHNSDQKIALSVPVIELQSRSANGLEYRVTDSVNNAGDVYEYGIYIYDAEGNQVHKTVLDDDYLNKWQALYLNATNTDLIPGEYYTAKVVAVASGNSDYKDSDKSAASEPAKASYLALAFYDTPINNLQVGVEMTEVDLENQVSGGKPGYTFELTSGTLPAGLKLEDGVISGTPEEVTKKNVLITVSATDSNTPAATKSATVTFGPIGKGDGKVDADKIVYDVTYGDPDFDLNEDNSFEIVPAAVYSYAVTSGDAVSVDAATGVVHIEKAGTAVVTVSATDDNYNVTGKEITINVAKKAAVVVPDALSKTYGTVADPELTYTVTGLVGDDKLTGVVITRGAGEDAGEYEYNANLSEINAANTNYTVTLDRTNKFTIEKGDANIGVDEADAVYDKVYGDPDFNLNAELVPLATAYEYDVDNDVVKVSAAGKVTILKAGTATVTISAKDDNYNVADKTVVINVAKKDAVVVPDALSKAFGEDDPTLTYTVTGLIGKEKLTDVAVTRVDGNDVGKYDYIVNLDEINAANTNYNVTADYTNKFTITKADANIGVGEADAVYNVTYGDADFNLNTGLIPQTVFTYTVDNDVVSVSKAGEVTINKAGTAVVTISAEDDSYAADDKTVKIVVAKKAIKVTADALSKVVGEDDPELTWTLSETVLENGKAVELTGITLTRAKAGTEDGEKVGTYAYTMTVDANANPNYTIKTDAKTNKFTIAKGSADIVVGEVDAIYDVTFGDADFPLNAGLQPLATTYKYAVDNDVVTVSKAGVVKINKVGTATVTISATDSEYAVNDKTVVINVAKKDVTATADAASKGLDKADPELTYTVSPATLENGTKVVLTGIKVTRAAGEDAGTYAYTMTKNDAANPNYNIILDETTNVFTIAQGEGTVVVDPAKAEYVKTYGDAPFSLTGFGIQTLAATTYSYEVTTGKDVVSVDADGLVTILGVGDAIVTVSADNDNYSTIGTETVAITVEKADLEITPSVTGKVYGADDPELTYTVTGLKYDDTAEEVLGEFLTRTAGEDVGEYPFGLAKEPANYNWGITGGFEITPQELTAAVSGNAVITKAYDGTTEAVIPEGMLTVSAEPGDDVSLNAAAVYENQYAGTKEIEFTTWSLTGEDAANYTLATAPELTGTITPAEQEITPDSITVTTGSTVDLTTKFTASAGGELTFTYYVEPDHFSIDGSTMTVGQTTGTDKLTVSADEVDLNNDGKAEYAWKVKTAEVIVKAKEDVEVTMADASVNYDGKAHALTASVPKGYTGEWTYTYTAADEIAVVPADGSAPVHAGKYTVTAVFENATHIGEATATLEIKAVPVTVTLKLDKTTIGYGDALPAVTYTVKAGKTTLADDVVTVTPDFGGAESGTAGTYTATADVTVNDTNYTVGTVKGATLKITAKAVSELEDDAVAVVGEVKQGETLEVVTDLPGAEVSATWKVDGKVVATGETFTIPYGTMGELECVITLGENYNGTIKEDLGMISGMDVTAELSISPAEATDGTVLTAALTVTEPADIEDAGDYTITWYADGTSFATGETVTLTTAELGKTIKAKAVSASGNAYSFEAESNEIAVAAKAPVITSVKATASTTSATVKVVVDEMGADTTVTAAIAKADAPETILETKEVVNGSVKFEDLEKGTEYIVVVTAENAEGSDDDSVTFKAKKSSGGGGGGSSSSSKKEEVKEEEPVVEPVEKPEMTTDSETADVSDADEELTKDAIASAEVDVEETDAAVPTPVEIKVDLSKEDIENPEDLTLVRYDQDEEGNVTITKLGGTYDPETGVFTGLVTADGTYGVIAAADLLKIVLQIDNLVAYINDVPYTNDVAPMIINGRTMVPLRFVAEAFGAEVGWYEPTKTVTIVFEGQVLQLTIDQPIAGFDTPAKIVNDRTLVPIRYISESFGADVTWVGATETVYIVK